MITTNVQRIDAVASSNSSKSSSLGFGVTASGTGALGVVRGQL